MTMRRMLAMTGGALVPLAVLALLVGNQWVLDAIAKSGFDFGDGIGPLVSWLFTLAWRFTPRPAADWRSVVTEDFSLLVLFAVLVVLVAVGVRLADPERGPAGAVITGWWATVVAAGVSGLVSGPLTYWALEFPSGSMGRVVFAQISQGASFGLAFGWLAGLGALGGLFLDRRRGTGPRPSGVQQPYGPPQPYVVQPGMPMQQPYPQQAPPQQAPPQQMQQHPSAVPYVPPQGQPPQPGWGAAPVPQQPGQPGGQFGTPPVPQQPSAPPQEQAPPVSPPAPPASPAEPEEAPQDAPKGGGEDAPEEAGDDTPKDDPKDEPADGGTDEGGQDDGDDDLDLADRTVIDRRRDDT
ncbi:hypothetical protein [Actinomadura sp. B10D3]|uniref:hypothetical protein n=1 Tax=Actinomadura sp. B10D3 TaxID=3153557 RepID=UPI00325DF42F